MPLVCVSLLSFAIRSYNYSNMPLIGEMLAQKCHQISKNAIIPLDVCSKMPLDIVIFTSKPLTMLHDKNKPILTMISVAPLVRSNQVNNFTGK